METQEYKSGNLEISDDVIATIALVSAKEVEGVATTVGKAPVEIGGKGIKINGKAAMKGVKVEREGDTVSLEISIGVNYGCMLRDVAAKVQESIYHAKMCIRDRCGADRGGRRARHFEGDSGRQRGGAPGLDRGRGGI